MRVTDCKPKFTLGETVMTKGAMYCALSHNLDLFGLLFRHVSGDWGDLCPHDVRVNETALARGQRILSTYNVNETDRIWIITEADRSSTTILLPCEY